MLSFTSFWEDYATCFTANTGDKLFSVYALATMSGLFLLLAHAALGHERCRYHLEYGATTSLYSLIGNICSTTGAIISRQLHIQVLLATFSAAVDTLSIIIMCIPTTLCRNSKAERIRRAKQRRRRQHLFELCVLMIVTGGFLKVGQRNVEIGRTPIRRRLLQATLENNTDILGYMLGILSCAIAFTSKFPAFHRSYTKRLGRAQMFSAVLSSLAASCYASALLFYDSSNIFIWRALPWLLSAVLCAMMDLLIVVIYLFKKQAASHGHVVPSPDTESLLGKSVITLKKEPNRKKIHPSPIKKSENTEKVTATDGYLHVSGSSESKDPIQLELLTTVEGEGVISSHLVRARNQDDFFSSDTSFDSSSVISSNLEWDFEDINVIWCEPAADQLRNSNPSVQEWQSIPLSNEH